MRASFSYLAHFVRRFARDEQGIMTVYNLFLTVAACAVGAAGLDVTHFYAARTQLQVAADISAHAALYTRRHGRSEGEAKAAAIGAVTYGMPEATYGTVLEPADIVFGTWDATTKRFTPQPASSTVIPSAVRVTTNRAEENPVGSLLFRIVGIDKMDMVVAATYTTYYPPCLSEGLVAEQVVDIQSNNSFFKGLCVHSNAHVEMNQNNTFELGTVVSMPDTSALVIPSSGMTKNEGLEQALREGSYVLKELDRLRPGAQLDQGVLPYDEAISTLGHDQTPWFLSAIAPIPLHPGSYGPSSFIPGRVHRVTCGDSRSDGNGNSGAGSNRSGNGNKNGGGNDNGGSTTIGAVLTNGLTLTGGTYSQIVIITDCPVNLSGQVAMEDVILYTTNDSDTSITASSGRDGLILGKDDGCEERGGATILTRGGMHAAAKLQMYGGQVRLLGDFHYASGGNAEVTGEGVSVVAGGSIRGTTHINISACGENMDQSFETAFFRLAQ